MYWCCWCRCRHTACSCARTVFAGGVFLLSGSVVFFVIFFFFTFGVPGPIPLSSNQPKPNPIPNPAPPAFQPSPYPLASDCITITLTLRKAALTLALSLRPTPPLRETDPTLPLFFGRGGGHGRPKRQLQRPRVYRRTMRESQP